MSNIVGYVYGFYPNNSYTPTDDYYKKSSNESTKQLQENEWLCQDCDTINTEENNPFKCRICNRGRT